LLDFEPNRIPAPPRDAATVVVLRDQPGEETSHPRLEVFCVRRHANSAFLGGAIVFPGGKVDPADGTEAWDTLGTELHPRASLLVDASVAGVSARTLAVAACREMLEEGGIVPVDRPLAAEDCDALREELRASTTSLSVALGRRGLRLALDRLVPWARWVTPEMESRRFDARFFLLELPAGQLGTHDRHETTMSFWARPAEVLERFARGEFFLAPPTTRTLELLAHAHDVRAALALAGEQSLRPICPRFVAGGSAPADASGGAEGASVDDAPYLALPGDPSHEIAERRVHGPTRFVLREGRFVSEDAPSWRAPNSQTIPQGVASGGRQDSFEE